MKPKIRCEFIFTNENYDKLVELSNEIDLDHDLIKKNDVYKDTLTKYKENMLVITIEKEGYHVDEILIESINTLKEYLEEIKSYNCDLHISIVISKKDGFPSVNFNKDIVKYLANNDIELDIDIYG